MPETLPRESILLTANDSRRGPFQFARVVLLFFLPFLAVIVAAEVLLWKTGETWPLTRVVKMQTEHTGRLFLRGILDQGFYRYKSLQIASRKPKILVLGSSRVMEFRSLMFGQRSRDFFNAGGMIQDLGDLETYVQTLSAENAPEILLLGIDFWWFNGNKPLLHGLAAGSSREAAADWQEHLRSFRRLKSSKGRKPLFAALRARNENIGIEAREAGAGFRHDGSMQYNFASPASNGWKFIDREKPPIRERILNNSAQFIECSGISGERLELFRRCLAALEDKKVLVLGFLPPVASESADLLEQNAGQSNLWTQVRAEIPHAFRERNFPCIDASRPTELTLDDSFMIDGIHAAETLHLHLLRRFLADPRSAAAFPGLKDDLAAALSSARTDPWQPDYDTIHGDRK